MTNSKFIQVLFDIYENGDLVQTRNSEAYSNFLIPTITFYKTPLVTIRKTAWKKALREMEWFLSGETKCPEILNDWWKEQLCEDGNYYCGYGQQLRSYGEKNYDQLAFVLDALKNHPSSRRIIMTTWQPEEMSRITEINKNKATPTTCHGTITQFFVRNGNLSAHTYQRSADLLLGVPHNWIQYWALLLFLSYHSSLNLKSLSWTFGDAHLYNEPSHIACYKELKEAFNQDDKYSLDSPELVYNFSEEYRNGLPVFKAADFSIKGEILAPGSKIRPKLL